MLCSSFIFIDNKISILIKESIIITSKLELPHVRLFLKSLHTSIDDVDVDDVDDKNFRNNHDIDREGGTEIELRQERF